MVLHQKLQAGNNTALITRNGMGTLVHVDQIRNVQLEVCENNNSNIESDGDVNNDSNTSSNLILLCVAVTKYNECYFAAHLC